MALPIVAGAWAGAKATAGWIARRQAMRLAGRGLAKLGSGAGKAVTYVEVNPVSRAIARTASKASRPLAKTFKRRLKHSKGTRRGRLMRKGDAIGYKAMRNGWAPGLGAWTAMYEKPLIKGMEKLWPDSEVANLEEESGAMFESYTDAGLLASPQIITDVHTMVNDEILGPGGLGATGVNWAGAYKKKRRQRKAAASMAKLKAKGERRRRLRKLARSRVRALAQAKRAGRRGVRRA